MAKQTWKITDKSGKTTRKSLTLGQAKKVEESGAKVTADPTWAQMITAANWSNRGIGAN